jgi:riboflavin biosynthesis pyrimidine reductase
MQSKLVVKVTIFALSMLVVLIASPAEAAQDSTERLTFIATAKKTADLHALHRRLTAKTTETEGPLSQGEITVHHGVRAIIVKGGAATCSELLQQDGIDHCEPDSIVSAA